MPPVVVGKSHTKEDLDRVWGNLAGQAFALIERVKDATAYLDTLSLADLQDKSIGYTQAQAQEVKDAAAELATFANPANLIASRRIAGPSTLL